jgi:hypothetical protein
MRAEKRIVVGLAICKTFHQVSKNGDTIFQNVAQQTEGDIPLGRAM